MASYLRSHDAIVGLNDCRVDTVRDFADCAARATAAHFLPAPPPQGLDLHSALQQPLATDPAVEGAAAYGGPGAWAQDVIADAAARRQPHRGFCVRVRPDVPACRAVPGLPAEADCKGAEDLCFASLSLQNDSELLDLRSPACMQMQTLHSHQSSVNLEKALPRHLPGPEFDVSRCHFSNPAAC